MSFQRATTPPRRSTTVWPQGSRTARKFRSYLEDPCAQPAPTPNSAKLKPSLGNPQATGYAGDPSGALWNAQQGTEKQSIFEPSNVPTLATRHESTTRSSSGPCFEHEVSLATNIAHASTKEADATVSAAQKLWGKADPRIYSPSMHGIETMPFDDVDSLTLEAELPRNHAMPRMPFYAGMEAARSTVAQTGSETGPSAEGPRLLELGSDGWRLRRLGDVSSKERKTPVLDMGSVYQGPYEDRYLAANELYAFYWPIGLSTMCHTGKDPKLEVTNTVLEGKAGPMFQASCKPAEPGLWSPRSHVHTFESDTNHIAWDLIFKAIGCTGLKKGAPCDTVLFGLSDSRVQEHLYLKWNAAQRRCIDQYEYDNKEGNRVGYRTTPEEVLKRGSSSSTKASIKANRALVKAANKAAKEAGNMQGSQLVQGAHAAASMEDPEWQPSSESPRVKAAARRGKKFEQGPSTDTVYDLDLAKANKRVRDC